VGSQTTIIEELARLSSQGPVVIVGTCDAARVPELTRAWGVRIAPGGNALDVCVYAASGRRTLANLTSNPRAAVTVTSPTTYRSLQVKGHAELVPAAADDAQRVADHQRAFAEAVAAIGLPPELSVRLFTNEDAGVSDLSTIRIALDVLFDQTPGPGAGARV